jgi:hypothetical protein
LAGKRQDAARLEDDVIGNGERNPFPVFVFARDEFVAGLREALGGRRVVRLRERGEDAARGEGGEGKGKLKRSGAKGVFWAFVPGVRP